MATAAEKKAAAEAAAADEVAAAAAPAEDTVDEAAIPGALAAEEYAAHAHAFAIHGIGGYALDESMGH